MLTAWADESGSRALIGDPRYAYFGIGHSPGGPRSGWADRDLLGAVSGSALECRDGPEPRGESLSDRSRLVDTAQSHGPRVTAGAG